MMNFLMKTAAALVLASTLVAAPAEARWRLVEAGDERKVARSKLVVTAPED